MSKAMRGPSWSIEAETMVKKARAEIQSKAISRQAFKIRGSARVNAMLCQTHDAGVPIQMLRVIFLLLANPELNVREDADAAEFFCGRQALSQALRHAGYYVLSYDLLLSPTCMDWNTPKGFATAVAYALRLKKGGLCWCAPVCSSWVFMSQGSTMRSRARPMGDPNAQSVQAGNLMVSRLALLLYVLSWKQVWWVIEQPNSSLLIYHDRIQELLEKGITIYKTFVWLGAYGHTSAKPTVLYSSHPYLGELAVRSKPAGRGTLAHAGQLTRRHVDAHGIVKVSGGSKLRESQHYSPEFGLAVETLFSKHHDGLKGQTRVLSHVVDAATSCA
jgi:hypothetical protein